MFCQKLCNPLQVEPTHALNTENVFVKVKNERKFHLVHLNEPKPVETSPPSQINSAFTSDSVTADDETDTFSKLFKTNRFNLKKTKDGFFLMDGMSSVNFSIIYKGRIKPDSNVNKSSKPVLFFLHGVGGSSKIWTHQLNFFDSKGYEIVAIDLLGHGLSEISPNKNSYQFLEMALDVLCIFDMFAKTDNVVIGHSYGCSFSQYVSQMRKEVISKVILISGGSPHPLDFKSPLLSLPLCLITCLHPILNCHFYCTAFNSCCNLPKGSDEAFKIPSKVLLFTMNGQIWKTTTDEFHKNVKQPVLLIEGENDKFVPINDALDMIRVLKNVYLVILKNGSHMMIMENHELINNLIYLFLNDNFSES